MTWYITLQYASNGYQEIAVEQYFAFDGARILEGNYVIYIFIVMDL